MYCLTVQVKVLAGAAPSVAVRANRFPDSLPASREVGNPQCSRAYRGIVVRVCVCVCVSSSYKDTSHMGLGAHSVPA